MTDAAPWDPIAYLDEINYNNHDFPRVSHIMDYIPETGEKTLRVCRCWQAKKFPVCDDTHKQLVEIGDNSGPFVIKFGTPAAGLKSVSTNELSIAAAARRGNRFAGAGIALAVAAGYIGSEALIQAKKRWNSQSTEHA